MLLFRETLILKGKKNKIKIVLYFPNITYIFIYIYSKMVFRHSRTLLMVMGLERKKFMPDSRHSFSSSFMLEAVIATMGMFE